MPKKTLTAALIITVALGIWMQQAQACSRILWNDNQLGVFTGRSMDWPESTQPILTVFSRGLQRHGGQVGSDAVETDNPARWTSKFGSMVISLYGIGAADGFNEKGLGMHLLYLNATDFGPRDTKRPAVQAGLWGQYLLDNAASVAEALKLLEGIQIIMAETHGHKANVHLAIEDAGGDSAIIEFIGGKPVIHHGRQYKLMTNDPTYDKQLKLLKQHDFSKPSSDTPLPGNVKPTDRFARAAYFSAMLPQPKGEREAVAGMFAIARNVSVPFGAPYKGFGIYNTEYRTVMNLTNLRYYFELTTSPNVIWADLSKFDLNPGAPVMILNPDNLDLSGNVTDKFAKADKSPF